MHALRRFVSLQVDQSQNDLESQKSLTQYENFTIEDMPTGYPRFSKFVGSHDYLQLYRKFSVLRTREIMLKQDRLCVLEERLNDIDRTETRKSLLGSCRRDTNAARQAVLSDISNALADYDELLIRNANIRQLRHARPHRLFALRNWLEGNPCICRQEIEFLRHEQDLITLSPAEDESMTGLEEWIEGLLMKFFGKIYKSRCQKISKDPNVYISDGKLTVNLARMLLGSFAILLIIAPVVICNYLQDTLSRLIVIIIATSFFIASLSGATQAKTVEIFVAGAAYATVLTVFITQG